MKQVYVFFFLLIPIFSIVSGSLSAQSGAPDLSLNGTGAVNVGGNDVVVQPDGKILIVSSMGSPIGEMDYAVSRFNKDGSDDLSFGTDGQAVIPAQITDVQEHELAQGIVGVALQSDGKIVVAGNAPNNRIIVSRLNDDGSPDLTFGTQGITYFSVENAVLSFGEVKTHNNTIYVGGTALGTYLRSVYIFKLNESGVLDTGFGTDGYYYNPEDTEEEYFDNKTHWELANMVIDLNGKVIFSVNLIEEEELGGDGSSFTLIRLNTNGTKDPAFIPEPSMPASAFKSTSGLAIQKDGKILLSAHQRDENYVYTYYLVRLKENGGLDNNFIADPEWVGQFVDIAVQNDEKIVFGSSAYHFDSEFVIRKLNTDGSPALDFDEDGELTVSGARWKYSLILQKDNQILSLGPNNLRRFVNIISTPLTYENQKVVYGAEPFLMEPESPSEGEITYTIESGDAAVIDPETGNVLIQKAGSVVINAFQEQWGGFLAATGSATLTINKAPLTATAENKSFEYGKEIPELTITYTGFVYDDDVSSITPPEISTTATSTSEVGTYPITLTGGSAENYNLVLVDGILTITKTLQTFTFSPPQDQIFSSVPITLNATASSGLPVTYEVVSGPATISGNTLTLTGPGKVTLKLVQVGDNDYEPASSEFSFCSNPPVPTITQDPQNEQLLTSSSPVGNQWLINDEVIDGATSRSYEATIPGSYAVIVTIDGCSSTSEATGIVTSIEDGNLEAASVSLHPNPAADYVVVQYTGKSSNSTLVSIYNTQGVQVQNKMMQFEENKLKAEFDLQKLPGGVYMIFIEAEDDVLVKKFVKR